MSAKKGLLPWLGAFVALDMVILGALLVPFWQDLRMDPQNVTGMLSSLLVPPAVLLLTTLFSADLKASLAFWRPRHALPGHRAFSKYLEGDSRINQGALRNRLGDFPTEPVAQNTLWYRLYRQHRDDPAVLDANKRFLLFRDLATLSFLLALVTPALLKIMALPMAMAPAAAIFAIQYVLACVCAQQSGIRFVRTVLAIESST